jgi:hypothetical protein
MTTIEDIVLDVRVLTRVISMIDERLQELADAEASHGDLEAQGNDSPQAIEEAALDKLYVMLEELQTRLSNELSLKLNQEFTGECNEKSEV